MIAQGFYVGENDWYVMCFYNVALPEDCSMLEHALISAGCPSSDADEALAVLSARDTGYTFTNFKERSTIVIVSRATSARQMYDTIQHELKHVTEHISEYYDVDPRSERAAYLQGELARNMYVAATMVVCPRG